MAEIETARLRLRLCTPDDLDDLADLFGDAAVMRYIGLESGKALTREEAAGVLDNIISGWHRRGFGRWAVLLKSTGQLIGLCGLKLLDGTPELMYILRRDHWGAGLATEAARACLRYGFEELRFASIIAVTRPENLASQRVLEKIGLHYEREVEHFGVGARSYALTRAQFRADDSFYLLRRN